MIIFNTDATSIYNLIASLTDLLILFIIAISNYKLRKKIANLESKIDVEKSCDCNEKEL